ncbi:hypothetical protein [Paenibacillus senegalimassiliensis]|uniref:hypothetical protein n=1 Tax=Paenibacillus senegalimassiliensis TaxID=1737426 RepID=UPI00073E43C9|nr:hypothetical protein [Paenibacillus senegalimassiliensis]
MNKTLKALEEAYYMAISLKINREDRRDFQQNFQKQLVRELNFHFIGEVEIYSHRFAAEKHGDFQKWDYLVLIPVHQVDQADSMFAQLSKSELLSRYETIRTEMLVTTPNSTYPVPGEKAQKRKISPFYAVEYVDVHPPYLNEFRDIMITNNGPAMRYIMENVGWCHYFLALETTKVYAHHSDYPTWNQIHVIGLYPDALVRYKKDFSKGLALAKQITFDDNFERLKKIRTMLYKSLGGKVSDRDK